MARDAPWWRAGGAVRRRPAALGLTATALPLFSGQARAGSLGEATRFLASAADRIEPQAAAGFGLIMGLLIFSVTTALLHLRERRRWAERERALAGEVASLGGAQDRAALLLGSDRQILVTWTDRTAGPRLEGDPAVVGEGASLRKALAFGSWLPPHDAAALERAIEALRARGEAFRLTLHPQGRRFVEADGRTVGGQALLRLREVTEDRLERLRSEGELAEVRGDLQALRALLDGIGQPIWLRGADGRLSWANRSYLAAVEAHSVDDARARDLELLDRVARDEAALRRRHGTPFAARVAAVVGGSRRVLDALEGPAGPGTGGIAIDVSELEAVRFELQRQMEAHVRTLDQLPTAVAIFDGKQRLAFYNAAYRDLWDIDASLLEGSPTEGEVLDHLRSQRKLPEQADFRSWKAGVLASYRALDPQESWWHLPDRRTLRVVANPNPQGGLTYLFDDVTERVGLESRYNALIRVQGETLNALKEGVAVFGTDGRLKLSNRSFRALWRLPAELIEAEPHIDEVIRNARPLVLEDEPWTEIRGAVAGLPDLRTGLSLRLERRDDLVLDCAAQPLPDGATLLTFVDMTASVSVERALTEKNDALERASHLRDDFVHHVSYELRSPLTTIIGFTQLLGDETVGALNARQREYADHIMRSSGALLAIINDILDLASIDTGSLELVGGTVEVRETIEAASRGVEDRLAEASLRLEVDVPPDIGAFVADGKRVRQVLFNLLSNAVGFSSPGQAIRVAARRSEGEVVFKVTDQGRGIPSEVLARVFNRFESHTLGTRHRGVGLGLSIVRSFVELHGGRVEIASTPGEGTTVTCTFPADGPRQSMAAQ
jgi:signal transduction histidine kinase